MEQWAADKIANSTNYSEHIQWGNYGNYALLLQNLLWQYMDNKQLTTEPQPLPHARIRTPQASNTTK